jgi:hypothetical protein
MAPTSAELMEDFLSTWEIERQVGGGRGENDATSDLQLPLHYDESKMDEVRSQSSEWCCA